MESPGTDLREIRVPFDMCFKRSPRQNYDGRRRQLRISQFASRLDSKCTCRRNTLSAHHLCSFLSSSSSSSSSPPPQPPDSYQSPFSIPPAIYLRRRLLLSGQYQGLALDPLHPTTTTTVNFVASTLSAALSARITLHICRPQRSCCFHFSYSGNLSPSSHCASCHRQRRVNKHVSAKSFTPHHSSISAPTGPAARA